MLFFFLVTIFLILLPCVDDSLFEVVELPCVIDGEFADMGTAQRLEAGAVAEGFAEVVGKATDVSTFATGDFKVEFRKTVKVQLEVVDADVAGFELHLFVRAGIVEGAFSLDFDGGVFWRVLFDLSDELMSGYFWRIGLKQLKVIKARKKAVIEQLAMQREEIKAASDDLRQPMARMTSIITNLSESEKSLEEREQLNALHSQMLQIITRVSDMQMNLENPEEKAKTVVHDRLELNGRGEIEMPEIANHALTSESAIPTKATMDQPTMKFTMVMIDDNTDFLQFATARLKFVYDFHAYNNIEKAAADLEEMRCDIVICKQDMPEMTGSDLCNQLKTNIATQNIKFVLMTEGMLTPQDMRNQNITLSADDYLAKPFNLQEATMRFNKLLGLGPIEANSNLIEGAETRMLEGHSSSMTTATETYGITEYKPMDDAEPDANDPVNRVDTKIIKRNNQLAKVDEEDETEKETAVTTMTAMNMSDFSMLDAMDQQLIKNIEQYVMQNMSRGQISLEELATAMGMGRVPFFHRIRSLTAKTPAELVRDMRLKHACILLKRTNINMSELATNVGFMTAENFINIFKDKFGMTPLEYRLKHRK